MKKACKNFIRQKQMRSETVSALLVCIASKIDTKRKIMAATGFSWGSVATYVAELLDSGVIYESDDYAASAIDRRTSHYRLTSEEYYALGVEVTGAGIAFALMSADGTLLEKYSFPTWDIDNSNFFEIISSAYCDFIRISNYDNDKILVTVCSLTGAVDCNKKVWLFSPHHPEIKDYDLTVLEAIFPGKLKIEHDIISKARSIIYCYHIEDKSCVFIHVGDGIGLAAYSDNAFFTGNRGFSGEIGHIPFENSNAMTCRCGKKGCLECSLSINALKEQGVDALAAPLEFLCITAVNLYDPENLIVGGEAVEDMLFSAPEKWKNKIKQGSWMNAPENFVFYRMSDCLASYGAALGCRDELIGFITRYVCS